MRRAWRDADRQRFADGDRLRAQTIPGRRRLPPAVEEWLDEVAEAAPPSAVEVTVELVGDNAIEHLDRLALDAGLKAALADALRIDVNRLDIILTIDAN